MGRVRFGWLQIALGAVLLVAASAFGGVAWILAWPALALFAVGAGYVRLGPRVFGKRPDGSFAPLALAALLPYHLVAHALMRLKVLLAPEDAWNRVAEGLYLGRFVAPVELPEDARVLVDMTAEFPRIARAPGHGREALAYRLVPTLDATAPDYAPFAALVRELADEPGPIFVHCAMGHGRSATLAAALLVARGAARDGREAEAILRAARPLVRLHRGQRELVDRFAATWREEQAPGAARAARSVADSLA